MEIKHAASNWLWQVYAHVYDGLLGFWPYTNLLALVTERIDTRQTGRIIELGCGTGNVMNELLNRGDASVVGVDISSSMLREATKKLKPYLAKDQARLIQSDLIEYLKSQPDGSADTIVSVNVLYAITDQTTLWHEIIRVLSNNGTAVITTSVRTGSAQIIREHLDHRSPLTLLRPKLIGVFMVDTLINLLGNVGHYDFHNEADLKAAIERAGGSMGDIVNCYGGETKGVNILFTVQRSARA